MVDSQVYDAMVSVDFGVTSSINQIMVYSHVCVAAAHDRTGVQRIFDTSAFHQLQHFDSHEDSLSYI